MGNFFKRKPTPSDDRVDPENRADQRLDRYYSVAVPASARTPDMQRRSVAPLTEDDIDEEDGEELALLRSLAEEVAREKRPPARRSPAPTAPDPAPIARFTLPDTDAEKLNVFRDLQPDAERPSIMQSLVVQDVDIADLLDTLETTAAALRRRKAA